MLHFNPKQNFTLITDYTRFIIQGHLECYVNQLHASLAKREEGLHTPDFDEETLFHIKAAGIKLLEHISVGVNHDLQHSAFLAWTQQLSKISELKQLSQVDIFTVHQVLENVVLQFIEHYTSQVTIANVLNKNIHTLFHTLNLQMSEMLFHKRYASLLNEIEYFKEAIDVSKAGYFLWDLDEQIHFCTEEVGVILGKRNVVLPHDLELYLSSNASGNNYLASRFQLSTFNELYCTEGTVSRYIWIKGELAYRNSRLIYIKGVIQDVSEQYCLQVNTCKNTTYHFYGKKHGTIVFNNLLF